MDLFTTGFTLAMWVNFQSDMKNNTEYVIAYGGGGGNSTDGISVEEPGIIMYSGHYLTGGGVGIQMAFLPSEEIMFRGKRFIIFW